MFGCAHLYVHRGHSRWPDVLLYHSRLYAFETEPHSCFLELDWLVGKSQGSSCLCPQQHWGYRLTRMPSFFCVECGSGFTASALTQSDLPSPCFILSVLVSYWRARCSTRTELSGP